MTQLPHSFLRFPCFPFSFHLEVVFQQSTAHFFYNKLPVCSLPCKKTQLLHVKAPSLPFFLKWPFQHSRDRPILTLLIDGSRLLYSLWCMINIKIKGPNTHQTPSTPSQADFALIKPRLWIGRGQDVAEKEGLQSHVLNLGPYSKAVSRLHACLLFSPAFFTSDSSVRPHFFNKLSRGWNALEEPLLDLIWSFARPAKRILLRDLQSKAGLFRKLESERIFAGMTVVLGDSRPLTVHNQEIHDSAYSLTMRIQQLMQQGFIILNPGGLMPHSFWVLSYRSNNYILLNCSSPRILIGRSSDCHLPIPEPAISRRHACLEYVGQNWVLSDGDGTQTSSNGVWVKTRRMWMHWEGGQSGERKCKVGDILLSFTIRAEHSLLHIEQCVSVNRSTDGSVQERKEWEEGPVLEKHCSQL